MFWLHPGDSASEIEEHVSNSSESAESRYRPVVETHLGRYADDRLSDNCRQPRPGDRDTEAGDDLVRS
jgi:hypothetical protein